MLLGNRTIQLHPQRCRFHKSITVDMRTNHPARYPFPSGKTVVSATDLKGRITHCNQVCIELSGFTREELLGQTHNLVRHPDVPEEVFRGLWATLDQGLPWIQTNILAGRSADAAKEIKRLILDSANKVPASRRSTWR